ncbi:NAD+ synthase [Geitlerinema sp. P-1104]|uniref:NAD+ synthase n=1 Tax=Geitlerinema sp. P-1104 TaxID=2546230 RepID=UPI001476A9A6|nr:NAD+ synthase [Geitlerinema sp. P-1104]NMG60217.1 NAD+ synthase [Geitlerinema sp. P-1104]
MKIAIAQLNPTIGDLPGNAQQILKSAMIAESQGVSVLLTPELSLCGYPPRDLLLNPGFIDAMERQLTELAQQLPSQLHVLVGTVQRNPQSHQGGKPLYNSMAGLTGGQVTQHFHKRLLPTYDVFDEHRYFEPHSQSHHFTVRDGVRTYRIGVTICEDIWNDEEFWSQRHYACNPLADLADAQVDLIVNLSASPYTVEKQQLRESMLSHAARRYQVPILYVNQVGGNDDLIFDGRSVAFNGDGHLVYRGPGCQTDFAQLELTETGLSQGKVVPLPDCREAEIWTALVLGVRDYVRKCGFSKVVLGLSGGIDSALVGAIAAEAVGAENVLGVLMSSPYTSEGSVTDAIALAKNLGIQTHHVYIEAAMTSFDKTLADLFAGTESGVAEENLQSRIRGTLLMAISNKLGHLLISTGNKSEMAVGYCTLYGDMDGGLAAIADVPKTQVYALCRWLNRRQSGVEVIPETIISKPPSAELKPNQTDQDSLPPYDELDDILHRFVEQHQSATEIVAAGYTRETVDRVIKLVSRAEFKRRQAAPGLKITDRAFGTGWRMPIACRRGDIR